MKYRYYSTQRPVSAGTYPKPKDNPAMLIHNYNERQYVTEIGRLAWGYIEYDKPLENADIDGYELIPAAFSHKESEWKYVHMEKRELSARRRKHSEEHKN